MFAVGGHRRASRWGSCGTESLRGLECGLESKVGKPTWEVHVASRCERVSARSRLWAVGEDSDRKRLQGQGQPAVATGGTSVVKIRRAWGGWHVTSVWVGICPVVTFVKVRFLWSWRDQLTTRWRWPANSK